LDEPAEITRVVMLFFMLNLHPQASGVPTGQLHRLLLPLFLGLASYRPRLSHSLTIRGTHLQASRNL
jgi:hypothetical protein